MANHNLHSTKKLTFYDGHTVIGWKAGAAYYHKLTGKTIRPSNLWYRYDRGLFPFSKMQVYSHNSKPITINGKTYRSCNDAIRQLGMTWYDLTLLRNKSDFRPLRREYKRKAIDIIVSQIIGHNRINKWGLSTTQCLIIAKDIYVSLYNAEYLREGKLTDA